MKKSFVFEIVSLVLISLLVAFQSTQSSVIGRLVPSDGADVVVALIKNEPQQGPLRSAVINGRFALDLKPGTYRIIVDSRDPLRDVVIDNVEVKPGAATDLGDIRIE